jgi:predicted RNA-binding Zn-ribbon protein involved in translation (DUF1610 family)
VASINCPSCGAPIELRSTAVPYCVCPYCQSVVMREGDQVTEVGKAAALPFDVSPIQLGTSGEVDGVRFEVIGRVRWGWTDGSWNEWLLQCSDGEERWLGEAMGMFQYLTEKPDAMMDPLLQRFASGAAIQLGEQATVGGLAFAASDIKQATCLGGEGSLTFPTPADWTMASVDFKGKKGESLSVQRDAQGTSAYEGRYLELTDMKVRNLRQIEGWTLPEALK